MTPDCDAEVRRMSRVLSEAALTPPTSQPRGEEVARATDPDVMVVDDELDLREFVAMLLSRKGFTVTTAANGAEALELLQGGLRPKLILLDLWMPVMDGETFCHIVHDDPTLKSIPICIVSADAARAVRLARTSASAFLAKPLQVGQLLEILGRVAS